MADSNSFGTSLHRISLDDVFPALDELSSSCEESVRAVQSGDYFLDSAFRANYQRYNANQTCYSNLDIRTYSASFERKLGNAVLVASQSFREASEAVPFYHALEMYKRFLISFLKDQGLDNRKDLERYIDNARHGSIAPLPHNLSLSDNSELTQQIAAAVHDSYRDFSQEESLFASQRIMKFMTDYSWWGGAKSLARDDFFVSPIVSILGKAQASGEIYAFIVRDFARDSALYDSSLNLKLVVESDEGSESKIEDAAERLETGTNVMIYGAPGTGKSWFIEHELYKNARLIRTVFHPEHSYFDFVGSYKPVPVYVSSQDAILDVAGNSAPVLGVPTIDYRFAPGPLVNAVVTAYKNPTTEFCLVIDEINRASASAVFGDMFQLLDRGDNCESEYSITPQPELSNYLKSIGLDDLGESFYIPSNLSIAATMNNADLGVTYLDTAFKRRWSFTYIPIDLSKNAALANNVLYCGSSYSLRDLLRAINVKMRSLQINEDRWIGPYFVSPHELSSRGSKEALKKIAMYLWDDVFRNDRTRFFDPSLDSLSEVERALDNGDPLLLVDSLQEEASFDASEMDDFDFESPDGGNEDAS